jgi:hypothetical protein
MANSLTIIECDRCCAFQRYDACEPWTSHECSIDRWGTEGGAVSWWVIDRACAVCGKAAVGFALIDHLRYCHDGSSEMPPSLVSPNSCFGLAWRTSSRQMLHSVALDVTPNGASAPRHIGLKLRHPQAEPVVETAPPGTPPAVMSRRADSTSLNLSVSGLAPHSTSSDASTDAIHPMTDFIRHSL